MSIRIKDGQFDLEAELILPKNNLVNPAVIICHGWLGNSLKSQRARMMAQFFKERNYVVLLLNLPGHGQSKGEITEFTLDQGQQALQIAFEWLKTQEPIDKNNISIIGSSIGGTISLLASTKLPTKKLVLISPRSDFKDATDQTYAFRQNNQNYTNLVIRQNGLAINFYEAVKKISAPTLIIHGQADQEIPYQQSQKLYNNLAAKDKKLILLPKADHIFKGEDFINSIKLAVNWITET
jgi:esterase/lipase